MNVDIINYLELSIMTKHRVGGWGWQNFAGSSHSFSPLVVWKKAIYLLKPKIQHPLVAQG